MNSSFQRWLYTAGAAVLLLSLTGVSIRAQEAANCSSSRGDEKQESAPRVEAVPIAAVAKDPATGNEKEATPDESKPSRTAPVSFLAPRPLAPAPEPAPKVQAASSNEWQFRVAAYLWLASISGTVGAGDITTEIDPSVSDVLNALSFGFMGSFEARKNRFNLVNDLVYVSLKKNKDTSGPLFSALNANMKMFMLSPLVGYRLAEKEGAWLDATVGIRFWHTSTRLELEPGVLAGRVRESSKNWADVIAGLRGQVHVTRILSLIGRGDLGGGGSDFTYQLFGAVGIDVSKSASLFAGYRYLDIKYTRGDFLFDGALKGILLGAAFRF